MRVVISDTKRIDFMPHNLLKQINVNIWLPHALGNKRMADTMKRMSNVLVLAFVFIGTG
jgi:hypothetical protein